MYARSARRNAKLDELGLSPEQRSFLAEFEDQVIEKLTSAPSLDSLVQSDLEDELIAWLEQHDIPPASRFATGLVEANVEQDALERLFSKFDARRAPLRPCQDCCGGERGEIDA